MAQLIFDSDGVIVNSFDFHLKKLNEFFGIALTPDEYRDIHNGNFYTNRSKKLKDLDFTAYSHYVAKEQSGLPLNDDVREVLSELSQEHRIHLVTSGWKVQVLPLLQSHDIDRYFTTCMFADDGFSKHDNISRILRKEDTVPEQCLFVTDTVGDLREGQMVKVPTIAVTFGYHSEATLVKADPTYVAHSWKEIASIVHRRFQC